MFRESFIDIRSELVLSVDSTDQEEQNAPMKPSPVLSRLFVMAYFVTPLVLVLKGTIQMNLINQLQQ